MKLLLVDDEPYTREGILSIIAFDKLGIDEVFSAEDGLSGLAMAKGYYPDRCTYATFRRDLHVLSDPRISSRLLYYFYEWICRKRLFEVRNQTLCH